jgi:hypothetical protein
MYDEKLIKYVLAVGQWSYERVLQNFAQFSPSFPFFLTVNSMQGSGKGSGGHEKGSRTNQQRLPKAGGSHFI